MKWFEEHKKLNIGSDSEAPGSSYREIEKIADETLDEATMPRFVRGQFVTQKRFGEYLGVGESTVTGWMKSRAFPDYAKRASLAAYYSGKYYRKLQLAKSDATRPKVVKDGERFMIVRFEVDGAGVAVGEVLARDIPTEKAALVFAGGIRAWELLETAEYHIHEELSLKAPDLDYGEWEDLLEEIDLERARVFNHQKLLEAERERQEAIKNLDDLLSPDSVAKTAAEEGAEGGKSDDEA